MSGKISNSPFIRTVELLKKEAEIINKNYKAESLEIKLQNYEIQNDKSEASDGIVELSGKKIDFKKFCTAELGGKYIDTFVGNEREPKTTGEILRSLQEVDYPTAQVINGAVKHPIISVAHNFAVAANISTTTDVPGQQSIPLSLDIFGDRDGKYSPQDLYAYSSGIISPEDPKKLITNQNTAISSPVSVDGIDKYKSPGMSFFNHRFSVDNKSILGMNFCLQDTDILHAFLNGITTLDLTKAITHLKIGFFSPAVSFSSPGGTDRNSNPGYRPPISLASSLGMKGRSILQTTYANSLTDLLIGASAGSSPFLKDKSLSRIGYEIFLAPQTLVNPDINSTFDQSSSRKFPVRDPMQPIASIDSFRVTIQNSPIAVFTTQVCELKIIVHDKSRLEEMSSFIAVQDFPSNFVEVEYGYNHPDSDPVTGTAVGRFLNLMKMKQLYTVAGYSMSIKDQSAEINLKLVSLADRALTSVPCITGFSISTKTALQYLNNLSLTSFPDLFSKSTLQFDPATSAGRMVERRFFTTLVEAVNASSDYKNDDAVATALTQLSSAIKSNKIAENSSVTPNQLQESMLQAAGSIGINSGNFPDGFFNTMAGVSVNGFSFADIFRKSHTEINYTSAGQLISRFVLAPLASSTIFDEVQVHCFSFNDRACYLSKQPIAVCPIDLNNLKVRLKWDNTMKLNRVYSTSEMLNAILKECSNPHNAGFGVSDPVKQVQDARQAAEKAKADTAEGSTPNGSEKTADEQKAEAALTSKISDIYSQVYRTPPEDPVFTVPRVKSTIQSLKKTLPSGKEISICKIIIYDDACTSLSELASILGVASEDLASYQPKIDSSDKGVQVINTGARDDIRVVRNILRKLYPSLKIGTGNSVVNGVSISTNTSGDVAQAQLMEALRGVYGAQQESMPESAGEDITVIPAKVSFNIPGCPVVTRGQSIFVDLGTGTTLDNVYTVSSVSHNIDGRGNFTTAVSLAPTSGGTVRGVSTKLERALKKFTSTSKS